MISFLTVWILNKDRGVPLALIFVVGALLVWTFVAKRTTFGRHVYAVGGNAEAARRAGINVARIRILVFAIAGGMSGLGGIVLAARLNSVDLNAGGGTLLIDAIAAAVIGGTSLFGGRGEIRNALIGAALISTVSNGMFIIGSHDRHDLHRHRLDPARRGHLRHRRAAPAGALGPLALARQRGRDDPVGLHVAEPHRGAARVAHRKRGDDGGFPEPEVDARILRREVARAGVHLLRHAATIGKGHGDESARREARKPHLEPVS